jgi:hypothetical protein
MMMNLSVLLMVGVESIDLFVADEYDVNVNGEKVHATVHVGESNDGSEGKEMMLTSAFDRLLRY